MVARKSKRVFPAFVFKDGLTGQEAENLVNELLELDYRLLSFERQTDAFFAIFSVSMVSARHAAFLTAFDRKHEQEFSQKLGVEIAPKAFGKPKLGQVKS